MIERFDGQKVDGYFFGLNDKIKLPKFEKIGNYSSKDGQIEIDLVCKNSQTWFVEIKWKNRATGIQDVRRFYQKIIDRSRLIHLKALYRLWFILKSGFTKPALEFCSDNSIMVSSKRDVEEIYIALE